MAMIATARRFLPPYLAALCASTGWLAAMLRLTPGTTWAAALALAAPAAASFAVVCSVVRYPVRGLPADRMPASQLFFVHLMGAVVTIALWLGLLRMWVEIASLFSAFASLRAAFPHHAALLAGVGLLFYFLAVMFHSMMHAVERSRDAERRALEMGLVAREAELTLLRAQVEPHFLFNALNSIAALTHTDAELARALCVRLGGFLRAGLRIGRRERIELREELALARDFLGVEQARFGPRLRFEEAVDESALACTVPPMLLQPLLENAVRHGIAGLVEGGEIQLAAAIEEKMLVIVVENPRDEAARSARGEGLGLSNVRRRIETFYDGVGELRVQETPRSFRVELRIPTHETAPQEAGARGEDEQHQARS